MSIMLKRPDRAQPIRRGALIPVVLFTFVMGCSGASAIYDATAYKQATDLKAEAVTLAEKAVEPASDHLDEIQELRLELRKALEYEKGRARNEITTRMWEVMIDPDRHLLGGFLQRWETSGTLSPAFVDEAGEQIGDAFDQIIGLEAGKLDPQDVDSSIFPGL